MRFWTLAFAFPLINTGSIGFAIYFNFINTFFLNIQFSYCSNYKRRIPIKKNEQSVNISQVDENIRQNMLNHSKTCFNYRPQAKHQTGSFPFA